MTGFVVHGHIYLIYKHDIFFLNIYMHVCVGLFIYTQYTHIYYVYKSVDFGCDESFDRTTEIEILSRVKYDQRL